MEEFDHLKIQLKDVILATNTFAPNKRIGSGGFGSVYKGELSRPEGLVTVACKRSDPQFGQGHVEFLKEIQMLSKYKHENLVSLLHFCIEGDERILVYQYASRGSLDSYLSDPSLTWTQRLKICVGAARALKYLHDPADTHQRILHRDIKSSNILLDEEWNAKVSDFGLSKIGPANQPQTYVVSNAVGTPGYCDPLYVETGILTKESDVYSFGVVLFEVMCGTVCYEYLDGSFHAIFVPTWKKCYEEKRLDDIVFHGLKEHMEPGSLEIFSTIAYLCLERSREARPTMGEIVQKLEIALEQQEDVGKRMNFEGMRRIADDLAGSRLSYATQSQLLMLFMKGVLAGDGETVFSANKNGQYYELISAQKCISTSDVVAPLWVRGQLFTAAAAAAAAKTRKVSRFQYLFKYNMYLIQDFRLKVKTRFLSPNVTYIVNLLYGASDHRQFRRVLPFKYKLQTMSRYWTSCAAQYHGEDGWPRIELFQFTSTKNEHYFDIQFSNELYGQCDQDMSIYIEGVEFCPVDSENEENKVDLHSVNYSDIDWDEILELSKDIEESMSVEEAYFRVRKGIYINDSQQWFSISKNLKKRLMLPARAVLEKENWTSKHLSKRERYVWKELPGSRFKEVAESCDGDYLTNDFQNTPQLLSPNTRYACYLVFKLPENASSMFEGVVLSCFESYLGRLPHMPSPREDCIYLVAPPHTPIIQISPGEEPSRARKIKRHPKLRKDGWMEILVWVFNSYDDRKEGYLRSLKRMEFYWHSCARH